MKLALAIFIVLGTAVPVLAQQVDIRVTPPGREGRADFTRPGPFHEITQPRENEWYPQGVPVPFDPAFVASEEYETPTTRGQYGVAGWTAQNIPTGPSLGPSGVHSHDQAGWLSFGFTFTWGAAPRSATRPAAGAPRPTAVPSR
jgi:hypothetical protein